MLEFITMLEFNDRYTTGLIVAMFIELYLIAFYIFYTSDRFDAAKYFSAFFSICINALLLSIVFNLLLCLIFVFFWGRYIIIIKGVFEQVLLVSDISLGASICIHLPPVKTAIVHFVRRDTKEPIDEPIEKL